MILDKVVHALLKLTVESPLINRSSKAFSLMEVFEHDYTKCNLIQPETTEILK